ncbi:hypothetical protein [Natronococcus wangiae]|uniref:hypothetical protein n=1 Tax=Natronococcus wangiae TaxID=3068275 RepID=UPI00273DA55B|nr:hypothetical protein [Natronococcus sp. AD5]
MERRAVLKASGALTTIGLTGLAGCTGSLPVVGSSGFDDIEDWLVAPDLLDTEHYTVTTTSPAEVEEVAEYMSESDWDEYQQSYVDVDFANPHPDEVTRYIEAGRYDVVLGEFDAERVGSSLERDEYSAGRSYEGYQLYEGPNEATAYAVSDDAVISVYDDPDAVETAQLVVDAAEGEAERYADRDQDFEVLGDELSPGHITMAGSHSRIEETDVERGRFEDQVAFGMTFEIGEDETDITFVTVFIDENAIIERDIEAYTEEGNDFDDWREVSYDIDDNVVTIDGTIRTRDL